MEPELVSLETSEMLLVQEDHSENHSSTSDIIHLEVDLHQRAESDEREELQSIVLSMIGSEKELEEIGEGPADSDLKPPETVELLMCVEEPAVEETEAEMDLEPVFTHTPLLSEPLDFTLASVPIPEIISQVLDNFPLSTVTDPEEPHASESGSINAPSVSASSSEEVVPKADPLSAPPFELPVLLVGGAALVAVVGILTMTLIRK
ncbi:bcl-2-like protein 13 [Cyprinus carpio]|uniref:Bcl-2-like protein 13 n=1 Tax=Cyprinus carpio TaxID=7962 RepID=A0A9Q9ZEC0_CYPCA|nr:bcl-2-like protein 13 [Cyprinus carpio]